MKSNMISILLWSIYIFGIIIVWFVYVFHLRKEVGTWIQGCPDKFYFSYERLFTSSLIMGVIWPLLAVVGILCGVGWLGGQVVKFILSSIKREKPVDIVDDFI